MVRLEFAHYDYKLRGTISAKDFALSMVASADMRHLNKLLDRVDELNESNLSNVRITLEEFKNFAELRKRLQSFSLALFGYGKITGLLTKKDFQRAASQVRYSFVLFNEHSHSLYNFLISPYMFPLIKLKKFEANCHFMPLLFMW